MYLQISVQTGYMLVWSFLFSTANKLSARDMWATPQICLLCVQFHCQSSAAVNQVHQRASPSRQKGKRSVSYISPDNSSSFSFASFSQMLASFSQLVVLCLNPFPIHSPIQHSPTQRHHRSHYVRGPYHRHSHCSVVWICWSSSCVDNSPAGRAPLAQYLLHVPPPGWAWSTGEPGQERPTATARQSHNMYADPLWMIMIQSGFGESCVFWIRRSVFLRNQADTEQMLTWSRVLVWEKRNSFSFQMQRSRPAKLFAISLCFHAGCPADKSCTFCEDGKNTYSTCSLIETVKIIFLFCFIWLYNVGFFFCLFYIFLCV